MIYKLFVLLLTVNLFTVMANAEAAEVDVYHNIAGDDEILIEKELTKTKCLLRMASMLGSRWFNDTIELQRLKNIKDGEKASRYPYRFKDSLAQARYGLDLDGDEFSVSMKIKF